MTHIFDKKKKITHNQNWILLKAFGLGLFHIIITLLHKHTRQYDAELVTLTYSDKGSMSLLLCDTL